jgi:ligand-binding SRPBCC domain-containing protein
MADFVLHRRVWVPRPRSEVFAFLADPRHLADVNPPAAALRWLAPPPAALTAGAVLDFSVRAWLVRTRWRVLIREFDPPYRFVDVQIRGPFRRWEHLHRCVEGPEGAALAGAAPAEAHARRDAGADGPVGTWIVDRVTYGLSLGVLGRVGHAAVVGRQLAGVFDYRARRLRELLSAR